MYMLYAALHGPESTIVSDGCVWTKQVIIPLTWISAFLHSHRGHLVRSMHLDQHFRRGHVISITTDASPLGMGGFLAINYGIVEYFSVPTTAEDAWRVGLEWADDSTCQQAFEAMTMLIALRLWKHKWAESRCTLHVRSDNLATLSAVTKMQSHSTSLGIIAREMALDVAEGIYEPAVAAHVPGVANLTADALSRQYMPGQRKCQVPETLKHATRVHPPVRNNKYWRTVTPPTPSKW